MYPKDTRKNGNMDRGHGATYAGGDNHLLEYWEEYQKMIEETKMLDDYLDEECSPRSYNGMYCFKINYVLYIYKLLLKLILKNLKECKRILTKFSCCNIMLYNIFEIYRISIFLDFF